MRIAFYAPLKPPDHPVASGDREIARALMQALRRAGHEVTLASRFRSFDRSGDAVRQERLHRVGVRTASRLIARLRTHGEQPDAWMTYHLHHKAPDFLGPAVTRALDIPYLVAEASSAPRQTGGRWARGHAHASGAIRAADAIVFLNPGDVPEVRRLRGEDTAFRFVAPFIDVARFCAGAPRRDAAPEPPERPGELVTVAMMREGAKLASYRALAAALQTLIDMPWRLTVIGDGPARADVASAFGALAGRIAFAGALPAADVAFRLAWSDIFVWPAIDEAIGIALLEAQACGVPVVAGGTPGVAAVVESGRTGLLTPPGDTEAFAAATRTLLEDASRRRRMGANAFDHVRARHDLPAAAARLDEIVIDVVRQHRVRALASTC